MILEDGTRDLIGATLVEPDDVVEVRGRQQLGLILEVVRAVDNRWLPVRTSGRSRACSGGRKVQTAKALTAQVLLQEDTTV